MKIYKVQINTSETGWQVGYAGSQKEARSMLATMKREAREAGEDVCVAELDLEPYEISLTKRGVLEFLNNCTPALANG